MTDLAAPPVLSTPDDCIRLEAEAAAEAAASPEPRLSEDALAIRYEIARTATEMADAGWAGVALQFPDDMLGDAPRVVEALRRALGPAAPRMHVLADSSYSACCVDEVAAEHAAADAVVHYGRACLSPTARLPVVYVYTRRDLDRDTAARAFAAEFADRDARVIVMADVTLQHHVDGLVADLRASGYSNVVATDVVRDPAAAVPNRRMLCPEMGPELLKTHALFHLGEPPTSLLLALHSRFASLHVLSLSAGVAIENPTARTAALLRRRFARVLALASAGVVGILVNTLSVADYLSSIDALRDKIARAGKKSYTVVVGKLNPAKLANFAEIEGWVVVGCWESGLVDEDASQGYWRPVVTPFELEVALLGEDQRTWGGEWWGGIERLGREQHAAGEGGADGAAEDGAAEDAEGGVDDESLPPQFDLRTGRLVSHSRPMQLTVRARTLQNSGGGGGGGDGGPECGCGPGRAGPVATRAAGAVASVKGVASPGAEFLRSQRTWQGLGSDFDGEVSTALEEGRGGIARGYRVGEGARR